MYRQGDVLIVRVDDNTKCGEEVPRENGSVVLAHGEATGHAHAFHNAGVALYATKTGERHLRVVATNALLRHEEHAPIHVPPGLYRVVRQREYSPEEIRNVAD